MYVVPVFAAQQMPRHAGFAMVASATQNLANAFLNAFAATVPLEPINLPNIVIGGNTVSIQGTLALLPPQVAFHDRTDNQPKGCRRLLTIAQLRALVAALQIRTGPANPASDPLWQQVLADATVKDESLKASGR